MTKEEEMLMAAETRANQPFNLFHFKILALMVCRGTPEVKAGHLFDLVRAKQQVKRIGTRKFNSDQSDQE